MEKEFINQTIKKWIVIFLQNQIHIIYMLFLMAAEICIIWGWFNNDLSILLPIIIVNSIFFLPFIALKIMFPIRIFNYLKNIRKGKFNKATLCLIEDANIFKINNERRYLGAHTYRYFFHYKMIIDGHIVNQKSTVVCTKVDPDILGIKKIHGIYVVPDKTIIPIVTLKNKSIVLQNDCGFYDLAHDASKKIIQQYW